MYIRRKVFSTYIDEETGEEKLFSTTEIMSEESYLEKLYSENEPEQKEFNSKAQKALRETYMLKRGKYGPSAYRAVDRAITNSPRNVNESINLKAQVKDLTTGANLTKVPEMQGYKGIKRYKKEVNDTKRLMSDYDHGKAIDAKERISTAKNIMKTSRENKNTLERLNKHGGFGVILPAVK